MLFLALSRFREFDHSYLLIFIDDCPFYCPLILLQGKSNWRLWITINHDSVLRFGSCLFTGNFTLNNETYCYQGLTFISITSIISFIFAHPRLRIYSVRLYRRIRYGLSNKKRWHTSYSRRTFMTFLRPFNFSGDIQLRMPPTQIL